MITLSDVIKRIRREVERCGSQAAFAKEIGISRAYLNDVLTGNRKPGKTILQHLKLEKRAGYDYLRS